tara:strand:- start:14752 stop:15342 length:591 start_codon:yes stop_codon:yes gene_type:complete
MTSKLIVNSIRHTGASADAITMDASGNVTFPANATCSGTASGFGKFASYAILADVKSSGTDGGTFSNGAWRTRDLNTEIADADNIVSISSNQFTLQSGTYRLVGEAIAYDIGASMLALYNVTDSSFVQKGTNAMDASYPINTLSIVRARFTIASAKVFELQHRCQNTYATYGFGFNSSGAGTGTEMYSIVEIFKES